jgi:hypothetical protein
MIIWRNLQTAALAKLLEHVASTARRQAPRKTADRPTSQGAKPPYGSVRGDAAD